MARNIVITPAAGQLNPSELKREFDRVDKDKGGTVSKDELWEYVCGGHVGTMSNKDFNAMWSIIDLDGSGEVDFVVSHFDLIQTKIEHSCDIDIDNAL